MISKAKNLVAFLTIFPVGMNSDYLKDSAQLMYLFPVVGAIIGLLAGVFDLALRYLLPTPLVGILTLAFILLLTGLHHTDGLLDFGDGLMRTGTPEEKIAAMHDVNTGAGGLVLGLLVILATASAIASLPSMYVIQSLVASEALAKFAMTLEAWIGKSAHEGMNSLFVGTMHDRWGHLRMGVALAITVVVALLLPFPANIASLAAAVLTTVVVVVISNRHFKGVTGDVFGATNELARMTTLLTLVAML